MVCIEARELALTAEVPDDEFHQWRIGLLQEYEREHPVELPHIARPDVWLIMHSIHLLSFVPLLTYIRYSCCLRNGFWCQGEIYSSEGNLNVMQM